MIKIAAQAEAEAFVIRLDRREATALQQLIYRHGNSSEINRLGNALEELLRVATWERGIEES